MCVYEGCGGLHLWVMWGCANPPVSILSCPSHGSNPDAGSKYLTWPRVELVEVDQPWREVIRDVCTDLPIANFPDCLNRTEIDIPEILSRFGAGVFNAPFVANVDAFLASYVASPFHTAQPFALARRSCGTCTELSRFSCRALPVVLSPASYP